MFKKIKVDTDYVDWMLSILEDSGVDYELGSSEFIEIDGEPIELQVVYIDSDTFCNLKRPEKSNCINSHSKMKTISRFFVTFAEEIECGKNTFYEYSSADVIAEFDLYEDAYNLFATIEKSKPIRTVIIVEHIADAKITDNIKLIDGKTYWVAAE